MKTLHLPLKKEWYNLIEEREKLAEYREINPYWQRRLCQHYSTACKCSDDAGAEHPCFKPVEYTHVLLRYGYTKRTMLFRIASITIEEGAVFFGAPLFRKVFVIRLGRKKSTTLN